MIKVNLFDKEFIHTEQMLGYITCSDTLKPTKIEWVNGLLEFDGITVFTDNFIDNPIIDLVKTKVKILWLIEPRAINPNGYNKIINIENKFDYILTYDSELLLRGEKYLKYNVGQSRIPINESKIYDKSKLVNLIASNKTIAEGHRFRHEIVKSLPINHKVVLLGSGYNPFIDKIDALKDYMFSISITNSKVDNYFTEILIDNFMVGTVPIFWGCPNIGDYFDINGIITFNDIDELHQIIDSLTIEKYMSMIDSIKNNFILAKKYVSTDDLVADILKKIKI